MKNEERLLNLFKENLKGMSKKELEVMTNGMYIFGNKLIEMLNYQSRKKPFKYNSFPRKFELLFLDMELEAADELKRRINEE